MVIDVRIRPPLPEAFAEIPELKRYTQIYHKSPVYETHGYRLGWEMLIAEMDAADVQRAVLIAEDYEGTLGKKVSNETVAEGVQKYPERFLGIASVDPHKGSAAVAELEHAINNLGLIGLGLWPCFHKITPDHEAYHPLYKKCIELGIFVALPVGINFGSATTMDIGRPMFIDAVATQFPDLRIVGCHGGWPWILEMMAVMWRHPNVYVDISAVRPKYMARQHSGWGPLFNYGNTILQDRVMFSCAWPLLPFKRSIEEVRTFPLDEAVKDKWLYHNAVKFLGLKA